MPQFPEELIQTIMKMTGSTRKDVENTLARSMGEMFNMGNASAKQKKTSKRKKDEYTEEKYPHYHSSRNVLKYTLRITLREIKPAIWRKIEVPSNITLRHLGDLISDLMGWSGYHLNQFRKRNDYYMPAYQRDGEEDYVWNCNNYNQEDFTIDDVLQKKTETFIWEYDFGDSWEHEVRLSSIGEYKPGEERKIRFVGGKRQCPPEDCGSYWGYDELIETFNRFKAGEKLSEDELENLEWAGWDEDYDPDYLDVEFCERIVERYNK